MKKQVKILALLAVVLIAATGCTSTPTASPTTAPTQAATDAPAETTAPEATAPEATTAADDGQTFTVAELATYNGKDGAKAYVAVDGVVYDVTDVAEWADGVHNGMEAGKDLTDAIKNQSPHGIAVLDGLTVVGTLE